MHELLNNIHYDRFLIYVKRHEIYFNLERYILKVECLVSVIVLTFRRFDNLENNINSILSQSYRNVEIIISDDGSDNFNKEKIELLFKGTSFKYKIFHTSNNLGTVKNFNRAIENSNGKYIIPLSQDDCFANSTVIEHIVTFFEKNNCEILTAKRKGITSGMVFPNDEDCNLLLGNKQDLIERLLVSNFISGACTYYTKESLIRNGMFDPEFVLLEDYPYYLKVVLNGKKIDFLDEIVINYGESGVSSGNVTNMILKRDFVNLMDKYIMPNIGKVESRTGKRFILRTYNILKCNTLLKKILVALKYIDITLISKYYLKIKKHSFEYFCYKIFTSKK